MIKLCEETGKVKLTKTFPRRKKTIRKINLQPFTEIIETNAKNSVVPLATSNVKLFLMTIW